MEQTFSSSVVTLRDWQLCGKVVSFFISFLFFLSLVESGWQMGEVEWIIQLQAGGQRKEEKVSQLSLWDGGMMSCDDDVTDNLWSVGDWITGAFISFILFGGG